MEHCTNYDWAYFYNITGFSENLGLVTPSLCNTTGYHTSVGSN